jgi:hypothetical protein
MIWIKILKKIRKYSKRPKLTKNKKVWMEGQVASDFIKAQLLSDEPVMICRFGASEMDYIINTLTVKQWQIRKYIKYAINEIDYLSWNEEIIHNMINWSGFYPHSEENALKYTRLMFDDIKYIDVLGSWLDKELILKNRLKNVYQIPLQDMEPYFHSNPWSEVLEGKKVLVVHPFTESIKSQYQKREQLFADKRVLPKFDLITYKAIQTIGGEKSEFPTWFDALEHMKKDIYKIQFDIAIIGCGAYGFNLAAHIKRLGKKAVHMGGAVQILFGIKGNRWEKLSQFKNIINEHWVKPQLSEIPKSITNVEEGDKGGHYW